MLISKDVFVRKNIKRKKVENWVEFVEIGKSLPDINVKYKKVYVFPPMLIS
jgi:hypothetical protein